MVTEKKDVDQDIEELVERASQGDQEAIGRLYQLYQKRMIGVAHARLGNTLHSLTESIDLVQSVWKDLLDDLADFEYRGPDSFYAWLRTCLVRKIDTKRRHYGAAKRDAKKVQHFEGEDGISAQTPMRTPSQAAMHGEEARVLIELLERFPEPQREAMILRMREELSYAAIGDRIGRSADAAKKLYQRGIEKLIEMLPEDWRG